MPAVFHRPSWGLSESGGRPRDPATTVPLSTLAAAGGRRRARGSRRCPLPGFGRVERRVAGPFSAGVSCALAAGSGGGALPGAGRGPGARRGAAFADDGPSGGRSQRWCCC